MRCRRRRVTVVDRIKLAITARRGGIHSGRAAQIALVAAVGLIPGGIAWSATPRRGPVGSSGFIAGLNLSTVSGRYFGPSDSRESPIIGGRFGVTIRIPPEGAAAFDTGILYDRKGVRVGNNRYAFTYLTLPATLSVPLRRHGRLRPYLKTGCEGSLGMSSQGERGVDLLDFSAVLGGGIDFPAERSAPFIEVAYILGLRNAVAALQTPGTPPYYSAASGGSDQVPLRNRTIVCVIGIRHAPQKNEAEEASDFYRMRVIPRVGVEAGCNIASVNGSFYYTAGTSGPGWRIGGRFGMRLDVPQGRTVSIMTGLYFDRRGGDLGSSQRLTLDYLAIPLCAVIRVPPSAPRFSRLFVRAGPELGYLLRAGLGPSDADPFRNNVKSNVDGFDLGITFGGGFDFPITSAGSTGFIEVGYLYGLRDTYLSSENGQMDGFGYRIIDSSKDRVLRLSAGISF
jgi:hypothetical protein